MEAESDKSKSTDNSGTSGADANSLLQQSPFGRLSEVLGTEGLSSIFSSGNTSEGGNTSTGNGNSSGDNAATNGGDTSTANNPFAGSSNPFAGISNATNGAGGGDTSNANNPFAGSNPFAGTNNAASGADSDNLFAGGGDSNSNLTWDFTGQINAGGSTDTNNSEGGDSQAEGESPFPSGTDMDQLFSQSPWGSLEEVGITSFSQVFGGLSDVNNPFTGASDTSTDTSNAIAAGDNTSTNASNPIVDTSNSENGVYTWDFSGLEESNFEDPNNPFNQLLDILGIDKPSDSEDSAQSGEHVGEDSAQSGDNPVSGDDNSADSTSEAQEVNFTTNNAYSEFFSKLGGSDSSASDDNSSDSSNSPFGSGNLSFNGLPLPFDNPDWFTEISNVTTQSNIQATGNEAIGNGNWFYADENKSFGNGNWYFSDDNVTIGNGNWYYGTDNANVGNGNWNFGDGNATIGNGNWYLGNHNQTLGNGNWVVGDNNIVIGSPSSNGKIFTGNDSLIIGNSDWAVVVNRHEISEELSHKVDELLNGGISELQNISSDGQVLTAAFIDSFYDQISVDFLNLLSSGGNLDQSMSGTGTTDSKAVNSIINSNDSLASLSQTPSTTISTDLTSI